MAIETEITPERYQRLKKKKLDSISEAEESQKEVVCKLTVEQYSTLESFAESEGISIEEVCAAAIIIFLVDVELSNA